MEIDAGQVTGTNVWLCIETARYEGDDFTVFHLHDLLPNSDEVGFLPKVNDFIFYHDTGRIYVIGAVEEDDFLCDRNFVI